MSIVMEMDLIEISFSYYAKKGKDAFSLIGNFH